MAEVPRLYLDYNVFPLSLKLIFSGGEASHRIGDGEHRHGGGAGGPGAGRGGGRAGAPDEAGVHAGPGVAVRAHAREAAPRRDERRALQLLPRHPRVPPGDPRQPPPGHAQHRRPLRRHARHQGHSLLFLPSLPSPNAGPSAVYFHPSSMCLLRPSPCLDLSSLDQAVWSLSVASAGFGPSERRIWTRIY